ncbi:hypothetical protein PGT21_011681 [Puccinia graminis f. sp. tritici]|uniref:Hydrophobin n=1 Tax=Puccinia graminis f. sp. tritici TaxID=56615 RepID=A0A5B0MIR1_PUCGR|nr:hypothetical protein PGT21_011681 [Puccinia graminis f. sp. tritici]KAA1126725.1 hypothetical protein PGTUg99_009095 [Puccinia graminis f. sp. tritici]
MNLRSFISLAVALFITSDVANGADNPCPPAIGPGCCPNGAICRDKQNPDISRAAEHFGSYRYPTYHCLDYEILICN